MSEQQYLQSVLCGLAIEPEQLENNYTDNPVDTYLETSLGQFATSLGASSAVITARTPSWINGTSTTSLPPLEKEDVRSVVTQVLYQKVVVVICGLGLLGNILNIVVLTQKSLLYTLGRMEKFVYAGLIALAISDMLFCVSVTPFGFVEENEFLDSRRFSHFYHAYSNGVINIFIMSSTWLTVTMAIGRYFVMCHPFRAREIIGLTFAARAMVVVFVLCVLFNIPRFWFYEILEIRCSENMQYFYVGQGYVRNHLGMFKAYMWLYFVVCILVPLVVLACCNVALIRALRNSVMTRRRIRHGLPHHLDSSSRITLTLIIIVLMYIFLVCPAELSIFLREVMPPADQAHKYTYDLVLASVNTLQALNYALNFILYCAMNSHFRRTMGYLMQCRGMGFNLGLGRQVSQKGSLVLHSTALSRTSSHNSSYHVVGGPSTMKPRGMGLAVF